MEDYSKEFYQEGDYILNHYDRNSHADKIVLSRNLQRFVNKHNAQHSVQLTALRIWLALSFFINLVLLAVVAFTIGGN